MRVKAENANSVCGHVGPSNPDEGGNRSPTSGGTQPPSVDREIGTEGTPVGKLVQYIGRHRRVCFDDDDSDIAIVLDRQYFPLRSVIYPQANPDCWPDPIPMLLIQWLHEPGFDADERWKPRMWKQWPEAGPRELFLKASKGRGPGWVLERSNYTPGEPRGTLFWRVIE
jgi:hypothetical protein